MNLTLADPLQHDVHPGRDSDDLEVEETTDSSRERRKRICDEERHLNEEWIMKQRHPLPSRQELYKRYSEAGSSWIYKQLKKRKSGVSDAVLILFLRRRKKEIKCSIDSFIYRY